MAEVYDNQFIRTLASSYTAGSGTLSVSSAAPASVQVGSFRVRLGNTQNTLLKVTAGASGTTWTVTAEANDANAASGLTVYGCEITAGGMSQMFADFRTANVCSLWGGSANPNGVGIDFAPHNMTGASTPSPYSVSDSGHYSGEAGFKCFDGKDGESVGVWIGSGTTPWVVLDLGSGNTKSLGAYDVKGNTDASYLNRQPSAWTMQGSNDNSTWTTVDTQSGQTGWTAGQVRSFTLSSSSSAFRYWRMNISGNNGDGSWTEVDELYLYAPGTVFTGGAAGDFFLDYVAKKMYGPKQTSGTIWPLVGSLT